MQVDFFSSDFIKAAKLRCERTLLTLKQSLREIWKQFDCFAKTALAYNDTSA